MDTVQVKINALANTYVVNPTVALINATETIAASHLKMAITPNQKSPHFFMSKLSDNILGTIQAKLRADYEKYANLHLAKIFEGAAAILKKKGRLDGDDPTNEAEARYSHIEFSRSLNKMVYRPISYHPNFHWMCRSSIVIF